MSATQTSFLYPNFPGHKVSGGTSQEAAEAIAPQASRLRAKVLKAFMCSPDGMTADEAAHVLRLSVLTVRPRCTELVRMHALVETGERRRNASGRNANVLKVSKGE